MDFEVGRSGSSRLLRDRERVEVLSHGARLASDQQRVTHSSDRSSGSKHNQCLRAIEFVRPSEDEASKGARGERAPSCRQPD